MTPSPDTRPGCYLEKIASGLFFSLLRFGLGDSSFQLGTIARPLLPVAQARRFGLDALFLWSCLLLAFGGLHVGTEVGASPTGASGKESTLNVHSFKERQ